MFYDVIILFVGASLILFWGLFLIWQLQEMKLKSFREKRLRKLQKEANQMEFEEIYDSLINNEKIIRIKTENRRNCIRLLCGIVLMLLGGLIFPLSLGKFENTIKLLTDSVFLQILFIMSILFVPMICGLVFIVLSCKKLQYESIIIEKLIFAINNNVKKKGFDVIQELYCDAGFIPHVPSIYNGRKEFFTSMKYKLNDTVSVKLALLYLFSKGYKGSYAMIFGGIVSKIDKNLNNSNDISIRMNEIIKGSAGKNRLKNNNEKFEKYFDLYVENPSNVDNIITENVKQLFVNLYEKYGVAFEISIKEGNIYIRFFTGKLFSTNGFAIGMFGLNKKKMFREYVMLNAILDIIEQINKNF